MANYGNGTKLVGNDALMYQGTFGAVITGTGAVALDAGLYAVLTVAAVSGLPANTTGDAIAAGDFLLVDPTDVITPEVGDNLVTIVLGSLCDISDFKMAFSVPEIDITTQCDEIRVYRKGKPDMQGTLNGVFTIGVSDAVEGFLNQFIRIINQDGSTSYDVYEKDDSVLLGIFYVNSKISVGDRLCVIAPFVMFNYDVGAEQDAAQSFSSTFRFSNLSYKDDTYDVALEPSYYRWGSEEAT